MTTRDEGMREGRSFVAPTSLELVLRSSKTREVLDYGWVVPRALLASLLAIVL